ncbi:ShlB/FhaC/HecB family hemolysin secretion/activation protein [Leptolyngbya sp. NIES-2104]|uniref:ShlB/FhaC/HecB family hemolysin secretion/activation protein n=1 Tax=Leptolyngbya sp. NIES-2104 TaxID=1552121 RepID=UPI0006EC7F52|nr:ShlB/FhaC/HecB family hemolysin secretion/activation protein [Leptolyngbya sp. NIES-2104]GAP96799.1 hemolysin activation/secretion protein [Leptolyngbya sp. NIES-2104]
MRWILSSLPFVGLSTIALFLSHSVQAQLPSNVVPDVDRTLPNPTPPIQPSPTPTAPIITPSPAPPQEAAPASGVKFPVRDIEILGGTVLQSEVEALKREFLKKFGSAAGFEDLIELRSQITQLYIREGYVTSGAFLVNGQTFDPKVPNVVRIRIVEGILERIEIDGLRRIPEGYIVSRLNQATQTPINQERLRNALILLQLDPLFAQVNAELTAGTAPDRSILRVRLTEAPAFRAGVGFDNYQSPSVGELQGTAFVRHENLLGWGDRIVAEFGRTGGLSLYDINYAVPLSPTNTTLNLRYSNNRSVITEAPFDDLGIRSRAETISAGIRQPIVRSPQVEVGLGVSLDLRRSRTFLLDDIPFSFSEGPEDGRSNVTAIRFFQDWIDRTLPNRVIAARSQFSFGIDAINATVNDSGTDAKFFSWLGQVQWVQRLANQPNSPVLLARLNAQLTPDSLLSLERFSIGGVDSLRGYRQNEIVTDNGVTGLVEVRIPVSRNPSIVQLQPFLEFGTGWNNRTDNPDPQWLASLGLGVQWQITPSVLLRVDYGVPLIQVQDERNAIQDRGFYFSIRYNPF